MAKNAFGPSIPADRPAEQGGGIVHSEEAFFAQPRQGRGFGVGVGGESPIGAAKGDRVRARPPARPDPKPFKPKGRPF